MSEVAAELDAMVEAEAKRKRASGGQGGESRTPLLDRLNAGEFDALGWKEFCDRLDEVVEEVSSAGLEGNPVDAVKPAAVKWLKGHQSLIYC